MPRPRKPARLYLRRDTNEWIIRDGKKTKRTGCTARDVAGAEAAYQRYLATRADDSHGPARHAHEVTVGEILKKYTIDKEKIVTGRDTLLRNVEALARYWADKTCAAVIGSNCREYEDKRRKPRRNTRGELKAVASATVRRELGVLQAALKYAKAEGLLIEDVKVTLAAAGEPRDRWLRPSEAARLLRAAAPHARRFILLSLYTGRRMSAVLELTWTRVDAESCEIRLAPGRA